MTDKQLSFQDVFEHGNELRKAGRWNEALRIYKLLLGHGADSAVHHNMAVCHFALQQFEEAHGSIVSALQGDSQRWSSRYMFARICSARGKKDDAMGVLYSLHRERKDDPQVGLDLAELCFGELGDVGAAKRLARQYLRSPEYVARAELLELICSLYDAEYSAVVLSQKIRAFASTHLTLSPAELDVYANKTPQGQAVERRGRPRVALMSNLFTASPVYFFTIATFQEMSRDVDFYIVNRGNRRDWATEEWRNLATGWFDVAELESLPLAMFLKSRCFDAIVDLSGWMDMPALRSLSPRPASVQIKWVGGQSATTGLDCFDAFIADSAQVPDALEALYSEPVVRIPGGYVTYKPPAYFPEPLSSKDRKSGGWGVVANPAKLSVRFFEALYLKVVEYRKRHKAPVLLKFIDRRFARNVVKERVTAQLRSSLGDEVMKQITVIFIAPLDHPSYLDEVRKLERIIDTTPYSGGLTYVEGAMLGIPIEHFTGELFCERHAASHATRSTRSLVSKKHSKLIARTLLELINRETDQAMTGTL